MSSKRGRKRNDNLPPNRARDVQRAFRARRAAHLQVRCFYLFYLQSYDLSSANFRLWRCVYPSWRRRTTVCELHSTCPQLTAQHSAKVRQEKINQSPLITLRFRNPHPKAAILRRLASPRLQGDQSQHHRRSSVGRACALLLSLMEATGTRDS